RYYYLGNSSDLLELLCNSNAVQALRLLNGPFSRTFRIVFYCLPSRPRDHGTSPQGHEEDLSKIFSGMEPKLHVMSEPGLNRNLHVFV
ncbi:hypothetical protein CEXT_256861, partial [Caerostris extrusa]